MQQHGKLCRWNAERGFGFIKPDAGGSDVFVHITAFPRAAGIPVIGDSLTYEIEIRDGKPQAIDIQTARVSYSQTQLKRKQKVTRQSESSFGGYILAALLLVLIVFVYWKFFQRPHSNAIDSEQTTHTSTPPRTDAEIRQAIRDSLNNQGSYQPNTLTSPKKPVSSSNFKCDGRKHCSQMTSCAEATYFLQHCPGVQMDGGNRDGVPCESQWCGED
jgi:cold shock CspA family protein